MHTMWTVVAAAAAVAVVVVPVRGQELLPDPDFSLAEGGGATWGSYGAAGFNNFFGAPHASLFADTAGNFGGVFQVGIAASSGTQYEFALLDVRIEDNFNADFRFGLEFYAVDEATKLGETLVVIDTSDPSDGLVTGDGLNFTMQGTAVAGTAFVRPIVMFDNAAPIGSGQQNAFIFSASLTAVPAPASGLLVLAGGVALRRRRDA